MKKLLAPRLVLLEKNSMGRPKGQDLEESIRVRVIARWILGRSGSQERRR